MAIGPLAARRLAIIAAIWVGVGGAALLMARALDHPVGAGARDAAQPAAVGAIADPTAGPSGLPPLALVLEDPVPADLSRLSARDAAVRLRDRVLAGGGSAAQWVQLGALLQAEGRAPMARLAFQQALRIAPGDIAARAGLAMADGPTARAARELGALAAENPRSQLVRFNQGWLAAYRRRAADARAAWRAAMALAPRTRLGRSARTLLAALGTAGSGRKP